METTTRQIFLDTETTGINHFGSPHEGHRIIEIGAVEVINRRITDRHFQVYLKPDRFIDPDAFHIHGISDEFLSDKPTFEEIADEFLSFIRGSELVIHNAPFDIGFINHEISICNNNNNRIIEKVDSFCTVIDSLQLARKLFPGKRNSLDALCDRYFIDKSKKRILHGALLDAKILANVFLFMTQGQTIMHFPIEIESHPINNNSQIHREQGKDCYQSSSSQRLKVIYSNEEEKLNHENHLDLIQQINGNCLWRNSDDPLPAAHQ